MNETDPVQSAYLLVLAAVRQTSLAGKSLEGRAADLMGDAEHMLTEALRFIAYAQQPASNESDRRLN